MIDRLVNKDDKEDRLAVVLETQVHLNNSLSGPEDRTEEIAASLKNVEYGSAEHIALLPGTETIHVPLEDNNDKSDGLYRPYHLNMYAPFRNAFDRHLEEGSTSQPDMSSPAPSTSESSFATTQNSAVPDDCASLSESSGGGSSCVAGDSAVLPTDFVGTEIAIGSLTSHTVRVEENADNAASYCCCCCCLFFISSATFVFTSSCDDDTSSAMSASSAGR